MYEVFFSQSCLTFCEPMDCNPPASSVHGILQARGLPFSSPGDLSDPEIEPGSCALQADSLPSESQGKPTFFFFYLSLFYFLQFGPLVKL